MGMGIRDSIAMGAMKALINTHVAGAITYEQIAREAYGLADAMLNERARTRPCGPCRGTGRVVINGAEADCPLCAERGES